jgi:branched-chain amino acid aminotransferase
MSEVYTVPVTETKHSRLSETDFNNLEFGKHISDHMLIAKYINGKWNDPEILPFANISLPPTALALHYGQSVFEGMKAFKMINGDISVFRIEKHFHRLNRSLDRMCMPALPFELFSQSVLQIVDTDAAWVPTGENASLYIRPIVFASENRFGVKVSDEYLFIIITGPVGAFYNKPVKVKVEDHYRRAANGGTGFAKCAGNYGGAFYATQKAKSEGFDQVLWTDCSPELNIEESGTMNVFFIIDNVLRTAPLSDTILEGITRDSILMLAKKEGLQVEEKQVSAHELIQANKEGKLTEAFGAGTAAITAPISLIGIKDQTINLPEYTPNSFCVKIRKEMTAIRTGAAPDIYDWNTIISKK